MSVPPYRRSPPTPGKSCIGSSAGQFNADLRTSASLCTPPVHSVHDYYPFARKDDGQMAPIAVELVDRLAILVTCHRFPSMGDADAHSLRYDDSYSRMHRFARRSTHVPFCRRYLRDVRREFMVLRVPIFPMMLCNRAVPMLWHASLVLVLGHVGFPPLLFIPFC
jgi:hypothetical protein